MERQRGNIFLSVLVLVRSLLKTNISGYAQHINYHLMYFIQKKIEYLIHFKSSVVATLDARVVKYIQNISSLLCSHHFVSR